MYGNVPVRFGRGRLDSLVTKGLAAYLIARSAQQLPNGIASHDTFSRLFAALDPKQLAACAGRWMAAVKAGIKANRCPARFLPWIKG